MPPQTALTWKFFNGTDIGAAATLPAGFSTAWSRHFATQSLFVIPAAWLNTLLASHSFSQVARAFLCAKDDAGNASAKASPRQTAEDTISIDRLAARSNARAGARRQDVFGVRNLIMSETRFMAD